MTTFQLTRPGGFEGFTRSRSILRSAVPVAMISLPLVIGLAALATEAGLLRFVGASATELWFGAGFFLAGSALTFVAHRFEGLIERFRLRDLPRPKSSVEVLGTAAEFVSRLEQLTRDSLSVRVLDLGGLTRHLVAAPRFLGARCAPRTGYRHLSNIGSDKQLRHLVQLIRRSVEAEKGSYFCVTGEPLFFTSSSLCLVEREDGLYVFLCHEIGGGRGANVVLVRDQQFGRLISGEYDRLWERLEESAPPIFHDGRLDDEQADRLSEAFAVPVPA